MSATSSGKRKDITTSMYYNISPRNINPNLVDVRSKFHDPCAWLIEQYPEKGETDRGLVLLIQPRSNTPSTFLLYPFMIGFGIRANGSLGEMGAGLQYRGIPVTQHHSFDTFHAPWLFLVIIISHLFPWLHPPKGPLNPSLEVL